MGSLLVGLELDVASKYDHVRDVTLGLLLVPGVRLRLHRVSPPSVPVDRECRHGARLLRIPARGVVRIGRFRHDGFVAVPAFPFRYFRHSAADVGAESPL